MSEREYQALQSGLASARMEGLTVTAQTERDCARLLSGQVSTEELVREILSRETGEQHAAQH